MKQVRSRVERTIPKLLSLLCHYSTKEAAERIAYEFCEDSAAHNVIYGECRFNPVRGGSTNLSPDEYVQAVLDGLERGQKEFGVKIRLILCFMRERPG